MPREKQGVIMNSSVRIKEGQAKIFIVDDHPIVRKGLIQLINQEKDMIVVGEAEDADDAVDGVKRLSPDVAIVDISLRGASGIELTKTMLTNHPGLSVLIFSMYDESLFVERALRAGAKGYLMKQEAIFHAIIAIRKILSGHIYVSNKWRETLLNKFIHGHSAGAERPDEKLSDRELEVLQIVSQGFLTREIAEKLHVSIKTVESHYANIKLKIGLKNSHELIQYAVQWRLSQN